MTARPLLGLVAGAFVALALPLLYWILGLGLERDLLTEDQVRPLASVLTSVAPAELLLGPVGILLAGRSAGIRRTGGWVVVALTIAPVLAVVWLLGLLTLGGALGSGL